MQKVSFRLLKVYFLLIVTGLGLFMVGWAGWQRVRYPYNGLSLSRQNGRVEWVDPNGPAANLVQAGDQILVMDDRPFRSARLTYFQKQPGDRLSLMVKRNGTYVVLSIPLTTYPLPILLQELSPLLVALVFWVIGVIVFAYQPYRPESVLFLCICQLAAGTLASGSLTDAGQVWGLRLYYLLIWWIPPLIFHFHHRALSPERPGHFRWLLSGMYLVGAFSSMPALFWNPEQLRAIDTYYRTYQVFRYTWLGTIVLSLLYYLLMTYRRKCRIEVRKQAGVVALGWGLAAISILSFRFLPDLLYGRSAFTNKGSALFLLAVPFSYSYAILRYRLVTLERYIPRVISSALVFILLGGLYLVANLQMLRSIPMSLWKWHVSDAALLLIFMLLILAIYPHIQKLVNLIFYGGYSDYPSAVKKVSHSIVVADEPLALARTLVEELQRAMQLECACMLMPDVMNERGNVHHSLIRCSSCQYPANATDTRTTAGKILKRFQAHPQTEGTSQLRKHLSQMEFPVHEEDALSCELSRYRLPVKRGDSIQGLLVLGPKRGGELSAGDLDILDVVVQQAGIAFENAYLVSELNELSQERLQLHRQAVNASEQERKRLAQELHDQAIQALVGLNFHISEARRQLSAEEQDRFERLQTEVHQIIDDLRRTCADLRPPTLDSLGLVGAVRSHVRMVDARAAFRVKLELHGSDQQEISEEVTLAVYRVLQESLWNVEKHAQAHQAQVELHFYPKEVVLSISDDGLGFAVPTRLGQFTKSGHFGLVGTRERVEQLNGTFSLYSSPGKGCRVVVRIPLT